jgi:hypothetical protein
VREPQVERSTRSAGSVFAPQTTTATRSSGAGW